jgi:uncharacterized membrane protein YfcA
VKLEYGAPLFTLIWVFGWSIFAVVVWQLRSRKRERMVDRIHRERIVAIEKGLPPAELPPYEEPPGIWLANPKWPLGVGAFSIVIGLGWMVLAMVWRNLEMTKDWPAGLIYIFLGIGLWLHYWLTRR